MKILLDTCVWGGVRVELSQAGHDVVWTGEWPEDPGDSEILATAYQEGRVLVTLDKDFGELAIIQRIRHAGIIRLVNWSARRQATACLRALELYSEELRAGAIVTVEPDRVRVRLAPEVNSNDE